MPHVALRRQRLARLVDLRSGTGLEIGPLDSPVATAPPCDVRYADVLDTAALREHYRGDPAVALERIIKVDFPLKYGGTMRTLAEAAAPCAPYRWAVASHVIEHVPDLVGWLDDVAALLEDGGQLFLVVPDRRFSFDAIRPPTSVGQLLHAHSLRETAPSERAVYDHFRYAVKASAADLWAGASPKDAERYHTVQIAATLREAALRGEYVDSHVWVFSPAEFVAQLDELGELDLCDFSVESVLPTARNELEFNVVLRRVPRDASSDQRTAIRRAALASLDTGANLDALDEIDVGDEQTKKSMEVSQLEAQLIRGKREAMRRIRGVEARVLGLVRQPRS